MDFAAKKNKEALAKDFIFQDTMDQNDDAPSDE
jgi:hypothetical protein